MKCYRYDGSTFEFLNEEDAIENTVFKSSSQKWFFPNNTTSVIPPRKKDGYAIVFNEELQGWKYIEDHRNQEVVDVYTFETLTYDRLGELPENLTSVHPNWEHIRWLKYDHKSGKWNPDDSKKEDLINHIWSLRKNIRDIESEANIEYNGHSIRVDKTSLNDILITLQALQLLDEAASKTWICADGEIELTVDDFKNIIRLYNERREQLVKDSNYQWKRDCFKYMNHLLNTLDELNNRIKELTN